MALALVLTSFSLLILCALLVVHDFHSLGPSFGLWLFSLLLFAALSLIFHTAFLSPSWPAARTLCLATTGLLLAVIIVAGSKTIQTGRRSLPLCASGLVFCILLVTDLFLSPARAVLSLWLVPSSALFVGITAIRHERETLSRMRPAANPAPSMQPSPDTRSTPVSVAAGTGDPLSDREGEVAELLAQGKTYREIGEVLFIAPSTVKSHALRIYDKLGVDNKVALANALRPEAPHRD